MNQPLSGFDPFAKKPTSLEGFDPLASRPVASSGQRPLLAKKPTPKGRTWGEAIGDTAKDFASGAGGLVQGVGTLYGLATGNMDNVATKLGKDAQDYWQERQSDQLKADKQARSEAIDGADGVLGKAVTAVAETVKNPRLLTSTLAENAATFIPAGAAGRAGAVVSGTRALANATAKGASKAAAERIAARVGARVGTAAAIGTGAVQQGADVAQGAYDAALEKDDASWQSNPEYTQRIAAGEQPDAVKHDLATQAARAAFLPAAAISVATQKLPGGAVAERWAAGAAQKASMIGGKEVGGIAARGVNAVKGIAGEGLQETLEEGGGQFAANVASRAIVDPSQALDEGVGESAGMGFVGGAGLGGATGFMSKPHARRPVARTQPQPVPQAAPAGPITQASSDAPLNVTPPAQQEQPFPSAPPGGLTDAANALPRTAARPVPSVNAAAQRPEPLVDTSTGEIMAPLEGDGTPQTVTRWLDKAGAARAPSLDEAAAYLREKLIADGFEQTRTANKKNIRALVEADGEMLEAKVFNKALDTAARSLVREMDAQAAAAQPQAMAGLSGQQETDASGQTDAVEGGGLASAMPAEPAAVAQQADIQAGEPQAEVAPTTNLTEVSSNPLESVSDLPFMQIGDMSAGQELTRSMVGEDDWRKLKEAGFVDTAQSEDGTPYEYVYPPKLYDERERRYQAERARAKAERGLDAAANASLPVATETSATPEAMGDAPSAEAVPRASARTDIENGGNDARADTDALPTDSVTHVPSSGPMLEESAGGAADVRPFGKKAEERLTRSEWDGLSAAGRGEALSMAGIKNLPASAEYNEMSQAHWRALGPVVRGIKSRSQGVGTPASEAKSGGETKSNTESPVHIQHYGKDVDPADLVKMHGVRGRPVYVHKDALADESKSLLPMYVSSGRPNRKDGRHQTIHRGNLRQEGERSTRPGLPYYAASTRSGERPFKTANNARKAVTGDGQNLDDYEIREHNGGFVAVRKSRADERTGPAFTGAAPRLAGSAVPPSSTMSDDAFNANLPAYVAQYRALAEEKTSNPDYYNADLAKELFPEYSASNEARRENNEKVASRASKIAFTAFEQRLAEPITAGDGGVTLMAGGTGSGKSAMKPTNGIVYDSTMYDFASAKRNVEKVLASGRDVEYRYVFTQPESAFHAAIERGKGLGRYVNLTAFVRTHEGAYKSVRRMMADYAGDNRVQFFLFENTDFAGKQVESIHDYDYNGLRERLQAILNEEYAAGRVSADEYRAIARTDPPRAVLGGREEGSRATKDRRPEQSEGLVEAPKAAPKGGISANNDAPSSAPQATHSGSGEAAEEATPAVIAESAKTADSHPKVTMTEARKNLLAQIDAAIKVAPEGEEAGQTQAAAETKLDDFGEKLEGNRKDLPPSLKDELSDDQIATQPLSKIWPADAHEGIEDATAAALTFAARQEIPAKPRNAYKLRAWVAKVKQFRVLVSDMRGDLESMERLASTRGFHSLVPFFVKTRLLAQLPREHWKRVGKVGEYPNAERARTAEELAAIGVARKLVDASNPNLGYGLFREGSNTPLPFNERNAATYVPNPYASVQIDGKTHEFIGGKIDDFVINNVKRMLGEAAPAKPSGLTAKDFEIRQNSKTGLVFINRKADSERRKLKVFDGKDAVKEARSYLKDQANVDVLAAEWEAVKARDNVGKSDMRRDENRERVGENRRNGVDVDERMFTEAFGFRGVAFGNWVGQGAGAKARQGMLNDAYDALLDLSDLLGIPSKAISLNGTLGLSLGARGSGRASAHFEPSNLVINLTKTRGAGSLAHEWFHSLDNYFARARGGEVPFTGDQEAYRRNNFITYKPEPAWVRVDSIGKGYAEQLTSARLRKLLEKTAGYDSGKSLEENAKALGWQRDPKHKEGVRPQVEAAFTGLVGALNASPMAARASSLDKGVDGYWNRIIERGARSFENYVISKLAQRGWTNDYLANINDWQQWQKLGKNEERYPYLKPEEEAPIIEAFDKLFDTIESKADPSTGGVALFSKSSGDGFSEEGRKQFRETERAYGGRNAYDKAKADGKTKLTFGQWVQVRTAAFKKWFGDWEALRAQQRLDAMTPVKVRVPDDWRGLDKKSLRVKAEEALRELVRSGEPLQNDDIGEVSISGNTGVQKFKSTSADPAKLYLAADLRSAFKEAVFASATAPADISVEPNVAAYEKLLVRIEIDGAPLVAVFSVQRQRDGRQFYNAVTLEDGHEKTPAVSPRDTPIAGERAASANTGVSDFVRRPLTRVNPAEVSKVVDPETGEPLVVYHGTDQKGLTIFDLTQARQNADIPSFFFATNREDAESFGENVIEAFLNIRNPTEKPNADMRGSDVRKELERAGYDGTLVEDDYSTEYAAFTPTQIKSATDNNGEFSESPSILRSQTTATAAGLSMAEGQRLKQKHTARWGKDAPNVVLVESAEDLQAAARVAGVELDDMNADRAEGLYLGTPTVWLNLAAIPNEARFIKVLAHEALGHYGVEQVVGKAEWRSIIAAITRHVENKTGGEAILNAIAHLRDTQPKIFEITNAADRNEVVAKEVIAVLAEHGNRNGLMQRIIAAVRRFLRRVMPSVTWKDGDLLGLLTQAESFLHKSSARNKQKGFVRAHAFSKTATQGEAELDVRALSHDQIELLRSMGMMTDEQNDLLATADKDAGSRAAARRVLRGINSTTTKAQIDAQLNLLASVKARLKDLPPAVTLPDIDGEMTPAFKERITQLGAFLQGYAKGNEQAFDYGTAPKGETDIQKIAEAMLVARKDVSPTFTKKETDSAGVEHWTIRTLEGKEGKFEVEPDGTLQLHIGELVKNSGEGSALYAVFNAWAARNGYIAAPDRAGLSEVNKYRRTASMLSSALRESSTAHLLPHESQALPHWERGESARAAAFNIGYMALREAKRVLDPRADKLRIPLLNKVRYNFKQGIFVDSKGRGISVSEYGAILSQAAAGQGAVGRRSAQRAGFTAAAFHESGRRGVPASSDAQALGSAIAHASAEPRLRITADPQGHAAGDSNALVLDAPQTLNRAFYSKVAKGGADDAATRKAPQKRKSTAEVEADIEAQRAPEEALDSIVLDKRPLSLAVKGGLAWLKKNLGLGLLPANYLADFAPESIRTRVKEFMGIKRLMDSYRGEKHAISDEIAQHWLKLASTDRADAEVFSALAHESTLAGVDLTEEKLTPLQFIFGTTNDGEPRIWNATPENAKIVKKALKKEWMQRGGENKQAYFDRVSEIDGKVEAEKLRPAAYAKLRAEFLKLSPEWQALYATVRDHYLDMTAEWDDIVLQNIDKAEGLAMARAERAHTRTLERLRDEGVDGDELARAKTHAAKRLNDELGRLKKQRDQRYQALKALFESQRVGGPYFPITRYGEYFVAIRDSSGKLLSWSQFENKAERDWYVQQIKAKLPEAKDWGFKTGAMANHNEVRGAVDAGFMVDVESVLTEAAVPPAVKDAVWQRYLQTLPDFSIRKSFMHRSGVHGYQKDALKAFGSRMFHMAHQIAKLKYGSDLSSVVDLMREDVRHGASDTTDADMITNELEKRLDWIMNPKTSSAAQHIGSFAFLWNLAVTPAAALVNWTQTPMMGIPILGARLGGTAKATKALLKASNELLRADKLHLTRYAGTSQNKTTIWEHAGSLSEHEKRAMEQLYLAGLLDRTASHAMAGVGEQGVEYSATREKWMGRASFLFHHVERINRETTALAAYRLAIAQGQAHAQAVDTAAELTWRTHFDMSNSSRARLLSGDFAKVAMTHRAHSLNMTVILIQNMRAMLSKVATKEERDIARREFIGMMGTHAFMAGIMGVPFYGIAMMVAGLAGGLLGDDDDDSAPEDKLKKVFYDALPKWMADTVLYGAPSTATGLSVYNRIGFPDLFFRNPNKELEGKAEADYWIGQVLGPAWAIPPQMWTGLSQMREGHFAQGVEKMTPKAIRDGLKAIRYGREGILTLQGDPVVDEVNAWNIIGQAAGFAPFKVSEAYEQRSAKTKMQERINSRRAQAINKYKLAAAQGDNVGIRDAMEDIRAFNKAYPEKPITVAGLRIAVAAYHRRKRNLGIAGMNEDQRLEGRIARALGY